MLDMVFQPNNRPVEKDGRQEIVKYCSPFLLQFIECAFQNINNETEKSISQFMNYIIDLMKQGKLLDLDAPINLLTEKSLLLKGQPEILVKLLPMVMKKQGIPKIFISKTGQILGALLPSAINSTEGVKIVEKILKQAKGNS